MLSAYPACFFKEKEGYSVIFPDLNDLSTCGSSLEEALSMAVDCLAGHLYFCQQNQEAYPAPTPMEQVNLLQVQRELEIECSQAFVNMVSVDVDAYAKLYFERSVKKTLTIPAWLNKLAVQNHVNFSQVLQEALRKKLRV